MKPPQKMPRLHLALGTRRQASGERAAIKEYIVAPKEKSHALRRKMLQALTERLTKGPRLPRQDTVRGTGRHDRKEL